MTTDKIDFESSLSQLQTTINELEQENLPLEQALSKFQDAMELSKHCQQALKNAEMKISHLTQEGSQVEDADKDLS